eukprot:gene9749-2076_t
MILPGFKLLTLFIVMLNLFLSAALWVGWPSILGIYKSEGVYSYLCLQNSNQTLNSTQHLTANTNFTSTNSTSNFVTCDAQSTRFTIIYTAASSCYYLGKLYFGYSLDILGPKLTNLTANLFVFIGSTFLIFYQYFDSLIPGWVFMSLGGSGMVSSSLHYANLFPSTKSFVLGVIPSALLISGFLLTIFQYLVKAGIPLYVLFICYSTVQFLFMIFDIIWQPMKNFEVTDLPNRKKEKKEPTSVELEDFKKESIEEMQKISDTMENPVIEEILEQKKELKETPEQEEELKEESMKVSSMDEEIPVEESKASVEEKTKKTQKFKCGKLKSVLKQFFTIDYFMGGFFLCIQSIIYTWYTGTLFDQFALMGDSDHSFATAFNFSLLSAILFVPFQGAIIKFMGLAFSFFLSVTFGILLLSIQSIPYLYIQPVGFAIFAFGRSFLISTVLMYFNQTFGFGNIGILFGTLSFLLGILSFLQIAFKIFVAQIENRFWVMNVILIALAMLSYFLPIYLVIKSIFKKIKETKVNNTETN